MKKAAITLQFCSLVLTMIMLVAMFTTEMALVPKFVLLFGAMAGLISVVLSVVTEGYIQTLEQYIDFLNNK